MTRKTLNEEDLLKVTGGDAEPVEFDEEEEQRQVKWTCQHCRQVIYTGSVNDMPESDGCTISIYHSWSHD